MSSKDSTDVPPQTVPLLYDSLVNLGFNNAAENLLKDAKKKKKDVTNEIKEIKEKEQKETI